MTDEHSPTAATETAEVASASQWPQLRHVDPCELVTDWNVRLDATASRDLVASVRALGVLEPIVAVELPDGRLRVRMGHQHTLAAIAADQATVPVLVAGTAEDIDTAERIVQQWADNEHRTGLTGRKRIGALAALADFGLSATAIARRTRVPRRQVDAALAASTSTAAVDVADQLTLDQAVVVAEFDDDAAAVNRLIEAAEDGGFDHLAQRLRDDRVDAAAKASVEQTAVDAGQRLLDPTARNTTALPVRRLTHQDGEPLDPETLTACAGHAITVERDWTPEGPRRQLSAWCTDPAGYGHRDRWASVTGRVTGPRRH